MNTLSNEQLMVLSKCGSSDVQAMADELLYRRANDEQYCDVCGQSPATSNVEVCRGCYEAVQDRKAREEKT